MAVPRANSGSAPDPSGDDRSGDRSADRPADRNDRDDKERWRLAWHYADITDGELESLAAESGSLTEVARRALQSELLRRGLPASLQEPALAASAGAASASPKRSRKLATLCRFRDMPQALLAKSVLESAGIECLLADANIIRTDWLWSNLVGGVKLRVLEEDVEEASRILDQSPQERLSAPGDEDSEALLCPRCQSPEVSLDDLRGSQPSSRSSAIARSVHGDPVWTCQSCGHQWHELEPTG